MNETSKENQAIDDKTIATETQNEKESQPEITSEWLNANTKIHGWLSFFLFAIVTGGLISAIIPIATFNASDYGGVFCLAACDIVTGLLFPVIAGYTMYAFLFRKPNAVFWGKVYVAFIVLTNLFVLITGATDEKGITSTTQVIRSTAWGFVWFLYLTLSEQVEEIIPKSFRKITSKDWTLLAIAILLPVTLFLAGLAKVNYTTNQRTSQETELRKAVLAKNQRTDGKVIFTIPNGFHCEKKDINSEGTKITLFMLNNDNIGNCTICSDYDTDKSETNFDSYRNLWKDEDAEKCASENIDGGTKQINGKDCIYRITKYDINGIPVYWRYYLLFDDETGKVFMASCYDTNASAHYADDLLKSVRFK